MVRVSVIGANGYTGGELLNIFRRHSEVKVMSLVSKSNAGTPVTSLYPNFSSYRDKVYDALDYNYIIENSDVVFCALPHGASAEAVARLIEGGVKVVDLSADFRYTSIEKYEEVYKVNHPAKHLKGVYGLPELFRNNIKGATLIGNPGCYTTSAILPLYPLVKEGLVNPDDIIVDSASGTSGAGRKAELPYNFCEVNENFKAYSVTNHRHTSEIEEKIGEAAGKEIKIQFTPHLLPVQRGILSTIYLRPLDVITPEKIKEVYEDYYGREEFVIVSHNSELPSLNAVKYSNYVKIGYVLDKRTNRLIVVSALDNLIKGASGQAVQNMNIITGLPENTGLTEEPYYL